MIPIVFGLLLASAPIYRCESTVGVVQFTDRACPHGKLVVLGATSVIETEPSTKSVQSQRPDRGPWRITRRDTPRVQPRATVEDQCASAHKDLRDLRNKRRKGYSVKEANALEKREQALKAVKREYC